MPLPLIGRSLKSPKPSTSSHNHLPAVEDSIKNSLIPMTESSGAHTRTPLISNILLAKSVHFLDNSATTPSHHTLSKLDSEMTADQALAAKQN